MISLTLLDVSLAAVALILLNRVFKQRRSLPLPPGPRPLPIIGNVLDLPDGQEWKTFTQWSDRWGDIVSVKLFGQPMIIVSSHKIAIDLLDKKSAIYSDRPTLVMSGEMIGWQKTLALRPYGDSFRGHRRLLHQEMGSRAHVEKFLPLLELETHRFLQRTLRKPEELSQSIRKMAATTILNLTYGYKVENGHDPIVHMVETAMDQFAMASAPGAFLVDVFPALRYVPSWFPGAGWKRKVEPWKKNLRTMCEIPFEIAKGEIAAGTAIPNFVSRNYREDLTPERMHNLVWAAASMYGGGADTTVSSIYSFFLNMTLHPEVLKKAQSEIDTVIGNDRLPTCADRDQLPYVHALFLEVLRNHPVVPLGVPHRVMEDDVYAGYAIPEGSIVMANIWKMLHDPQTYANPMEFNPERFLGSQPEQDPRTAVFGFGRRICPGLYLAEASICLSIAVAAATLDISKVVENGVEVTPVPEYTSGTISHPKPFKCAIRPRSSKAEALIQSVDDLSF